MDKHRRNPVSETIRKWLRNRFGICREMGFFKKDMTSRNTENNYLTRTAWKTVLFGTDHTPGLQRLL